MGDANLAPENYLGATYFLDYDAAREHFQTDEP
jgi:hypothetical protein